MIDVDDLVIKIAIGGGIALLVYLLDRRRRNESKEAHKKLIRKDLGRIQTIIEPIAYDVNNIEKDREGVPSKLNQHMTKHSTYLESLIQNIQVHHAQCGKMKQSEEEAITDAVDSARWILNTYHRQDIPNPQRDRIWLEPHTDFHNHAKKIVHACNNV